MIDFEETVPEEYIPSLEIFEKQFKYPIEFSLVSGSASDANNNDSRTPTAQVGDDDIVNLFNDPHIPATEVDEVTHYPSINSHRSTTVLH